MTYDKDLEEVRPTVALSTGRCRDGCGELIHVGEAIVVSTPEVNDGSGYTAARYMHADCWLYSKGRPVDEFRRADET